jgi:hypothetical protein
VRRLRLALALFLLASPALAVKEFYSLSRSTRAMGTGGAFYGLSDDESAMFYNPAGVALYPGGGQFMVDVGVTAATDLIAGLSTVREAAKGGDVSSIANQLTGFYGKPIYGGGRIMPYFVSRGFAFGVLVTDLKADVAVLGRDLSSEVDVTAINDTGIFLTKAGSLGRNFYAGLTAKLVFRGGGRRVFSILDFATRPTFKAADLGGGGLGLDGDLGFTYVIGKPGARANGGVSLVFSNLAASDFSLYRLPNAGAPPQLPRMGSLGGFLLLRGGKTIDNIRFLLDLAELNLGGQLDENLGRRTGTFWKHINFGIEVPIGGWLSLRGGYRQGNYTYGVGIATKAFKLDFASYGEELFNGPGRLTSRRYTVDLAVGFGAPPAGASGLVTARPRRK